jgi:hypothetical protein
VLESTTVKTGQTAAKPSRRPRLTAPHKMTRRGAVRRFNTLIHKFTACLLSDGRSGLSVFEREMVKQAAALVLRGETLQAAVVAGEPVNYDELVRVTSEMRRVMSSLGLSDESGEAERGDLKLKPFKWPVLK